MLDRHLLRLLWGDVIKLRSIAPKDLTLKDVPHISYVSFCGDDLDSALRRRGMSTAKRKSLVGMLFDMRDGGGARDIDKDAYPAILHLFRLGLVKLAVYDCDCGVCTPCLYLDLA